MNDKCPICNAYLDMAGERPCCHIAGKYEITYWASPTATTVTATTVGLTI